MLIKQPLVLTCMPIVRHSRNKWSRASHVRYAETIPSRLSAFACHGAARGMVDDHFGLRARPVGLTRGHAETYPPPCSREAGRSGMGRVSSAMPPG